MNKKIVIFFILALIVSFAENSFSQSIGSVKSVLLLNSYHEGYRWESEINKAIRERISESENTRLYIEHLDAIRFPSFAQLTQQKKYLSEKYKNVRFDAIICTDNSALNFLVRNREEMFGASPIVFCGNNSLVIETLDGRSKITRGEKSLSEDKTIGFMLNNHYKTRRIIVLSNNSLAGGIATESIKELSHQYEDVEFIFTNSMSRMQVFSLLKSLDDGDLVLLTKHFLDQIAHIPFAKAIRMICDTSTVPVYSSTGFLLGYGVVGGYMTNGYFQGEKAAEITLNILSGAPRDEFRFMMETPSRYLADYNQLFKFSINPKILPEETLIINSPHDFYEENKLVIWILVIFIIILSCVSIFLFVTILRKNRFQNDLLRLTSTLEERVEERTSELVDAHNQIAEREEQIKHLISNLSSMVYRSKGKSGLDLLFVSEAATNITGYSPQELTDENKSIYRNSILKRDRSHISEQVNIAVKERKHFSFEYRITTKDGEVKWVWDQGLAVYDNNGEVVYFDGIITDISEKKAIELEQSKLAIAVQQTDDLILITDINAIIEYANPAFVDVTGYSLDEIIGKTPQILKSGKHEESYYKEMWQILIDGRSWRGQFINKCKNDSEYIAEVTISPITNQQNEVTHYVGVQRDITQVVMLERSLKQSQKLESLGTLAGGIAHEINTPAQFVTSNLSFVLESLPDMMKYIKESYELQNKFDDQKEVLEIYESADICYLVDEIPLALSQSLEGVEKISEIVLSMKQFAHPGEKEKVASDINMALHNTANVCRNEWKYVAEIIYDLEENIPLIPCLLSELNQVFLNLIVNASHAIDSQNEGGAVKGEIVISTRLLDDYVSIKIRDNGPGIPEDIQERIFDPFFTTKAPGKGTGQGLSIAHSIICEKHSGQIFCTSSDEGAEFCIKLPLREQRKNS